MIIQANISPMNDLPKNNLLRSWRNISAHLGYDVRTCHRWEANLAMPVHRAEGGGGKSPVFGYRDELDAWFRETFKASRPNGNGAREGKPGRPRLAWVLGIGAVAVFDPRDVRGGSPQTGEYAYRQMVMAGVRYWNGPDFVAEPEPVKR